jgi:DNA topoisomerase-1
MGKWKTLIHNGVAFPPEYEPVGYTLKFKGKPVKLTPQQEEIAVAWAKKKDTPYVQDPVFGANFLKDWMKLLPAEAKVEKISDVDFSPIYADIEKTKAAMQDPDLKKKRSAERKKIREEMKAKYGWAEIDGTKVEVANYLVEPPGIFMGRGDHPMRGKWKPRVYAGDVTLNLTKGAPAPPGAWRKTVHDQDATWLARWIDKLSDREKYVWLSDAAGLRQERDMAKYDKARKLAENFDKVVDKIYRAMGGRRTKPRMVSTTAFLIYRLAMRVGDEKDPDEADTVGASTLRVEHVKLKGDVVEFDFLGKDCVRWQKTLEAKGRDRVVFENLEKFTAGKKPDALIFSDVTSRTVNEFFGSVLKGLTAKVFRTYLATEVVRRYLSSLDKGVVKDSEHVKLYQAKMANLQAAIMCNHKRAIPKNFEESLKAKKDLLEQIKTQGPKTDKATERLKARQEKLKLQLELAIQTRDYNLGTSLRNYIDARVYRAWCKHVGLDWTKLYTKTLQRKFMWTDRATPQWEKLAQRPEAVHLPSVQ